MQNHLPPVDIPRGKYLAVVQLRCLTCWDSTAQHSRRRLQSRTDHRFRLRSESRNLLPNHYVLWQYCPVDRTGDLRRRWGGMQANGYFLVRNGYDRGGSEEPVVC